ncbi:MAG TPA: FUSC family protein [Microlunatus sp.]|nr:FUSC family protein [Microlunatus sp.]
MTLIGLDPPPGQALGRSLRHALRPSHRPPAGRAAVRAVLAGGLIVVIGVACGDLGAVAIAYLGAACSVIFLLGERPRLQLISLATQAAGAACGLALAGLLPALPISQVVAATAVGVVSGLVGRRGVTAPGFGMMLSIGLAYGQFGGSSLTWSEQIVWYVLGTAVVALATMARLPRRRLPERSGDDRADLPAATFSRSAVDTGLRLGLGMGLATAVTLALHPSEHAFWLPLTVAAVIRPEYGSVWARTVNRVGGTVIGAAAAAGLLLVVPTGLPTAGAAALALGFAAWTAPRLYGLSIIGVTASALLSGSIARTDAVGPGWRLVDTLIGALIALSVEGLWGHGDRPTRPAISRRPRRSDRQPRDRRPAAP